MDLTVRNHDNQASIDWCTSARAAEVAGKPKDALEMYAKAAGYLVKAIDTLKPKSDERRRAKLQLRHVTDRQAALKSFALLGGSPPDPLPSSESLAAELQSPNAVIPLTLVQFGRIASLPQSGEQNLLTPLLNTSLPDHTFHVYVEKLDRYPNIWIYFHIKDDSRTQILYTLAAVKRPRYQIPSCTFSRACQQESPIANIRVGSVRRRQSATEIAAVGRPFDINIGSGHVIQVAPDSEENTWLPSRFTYGGRTFVWRAGEGVLNTVETLHEVSKQWPDPTSKTGKILEEFCERKLVWGEGKFAVNKVCTIHTVGGLDQMFREFVLADIATRRLIGLYGH